MIKRHCNDCNKKVNVLEETIEGEDYISCANCGKVLAKIDFNWEENS